MAPTGKTSPRYRARMAGVCYVLMFLAGGLATLARKGLIISGDAAATATNILAHQSSYLLAYAGDTLVIASYVAVVALLYRMLRPVSRSISLTAAFFGLMGCAVQASALVFQLAPLSILGAQYLSAFKLEQLQALAYLCLKLYSQAYGVALVFFSLFLFFTGYLIFKSTFLPPILGLLLMLGLIGLAFLSPPFATKYVYYILAGSIGEGLLTLWLLVKGVDSERWKAASDVARTTD